MRFSQQVLDEIRARVALSTVVGRRVAWDKRKSAPARGDYWACCPFHGEKTPSFHVDDRKGFYHCFGCGVSGDHVRFLTEKEGLSFPDAVAQLAELAGLPLPAADPEAERRERAEAGLHDVMEMATAYFEGLLNAREGAAARSYLQRRRLGPDLQKRFRLGYAGPGRSGLKEHLAGKGVGLERMIEAGLLVAGDDIPVAFDRFRDRVMFPITDFRGKVVAFGGRAMAADAQAKYLNSPETPIFQKGGLLYNFAEARRAAEKAGTIVVVEGYVDTIACVAAGIGHTVAPLGTALTERQLQLLWRVVPEPILCFDGDAAGQRAAARAVELALPHAGPGRSLRFATLPEGQDPDDLIGTGGAEAMRDVLDQARPLADTIWARETAGGVFETPERRAELDQRLAALARTIQDPGTRHYYLETFRERVRAFFAPARGGRAVGARSFAARANSEWRMANRGGRGAAAGHSPFAPRYAPYSPAETAPVSDGLARLARRSAAALPLREVVLVMTAVNHPALAAHHLDEFAHLDLATRELDNLRQRVLEAVSEEPTIGRDALRRHLDATGLSSFIARLDAQVAGSSHWQARPEAAESDAEIGWMQAIALQKRARTLHRELMDAEAALASEPTDANLARLTEIKRILASADGTEALVEGFGSQSGREAKTF